MALKLGLFDLYSSRRVCYITMRCNTRQPKPYNRACFSPHAIVDTDIFMWISRL